MVWGGQGGVGGAGGCRRGTATCGCGRIMRAFMRSTRIHCDPDGARSPHDHGGRDASVPPAAAPVLRVMGV
eukprot:SAG11_NODE_177_length_13334_cov_9.614280_13_plen_71_part_00